MTIYKVTEIQTKKPTRNADTQSQHSKQLLPVLDLEWERMVIRAQRENCTTGQNLSNRRSSFQQRNETTVNRQPNRKAARESYNPMSSGPPCNRIIHPHPRPLPWCLPSPSDRARFLILMKLSLVTCLAESSRTLIGVI